MRGVEGGGERKNISIREVLARLMRRVEEEKPPEEQVVSDMFAHPETMKITTDLEKGGTHQDEKHPSS